MTPSSDRIALLYREWLTRECEVLKRELSACRGDSLVAVTCRVETGTEASWRELLSRLTSSGKFFTIVDNGGTWTACRVYVIIAPLFVVWVSFRSLLLRMALTEQNWWSLHFPLKFPPISGRTWSLVGKFLQDVYIYSLSKWNIVSTRFANSPTISSWEQDRLVFLKNIIPLGIEDDSLVMEEILSHPLRNRYKYRNSLSQFQNSQSLSINSSSRKHWNFQNLWFSFSFSLRILRNPWEYIASKSERKEMTIPR